MDWRDAEANKDVIEQAKIAVIILRLPKASWKRP